MELNDCKVISIIKFHAFHLLLKLDNVLFKPAELTKSTNENYIRSEQRSARHSTLSYLSKSAGWELNKSLNQKHTTRHISNYSSARDCYISVTIFFPILTSFSELCPPLNQNWHFRFDTSSCSNLNRMFRLSAKRWIQKNWTEWQMTKNQLECPYVIYLALCSRKFKLSTCLSIKLTLPWKFQLFQNMTIEAKLLRQNAES